MGHGRTAADDGKRPSMCFRFLNDGQAQRVSMSNMPQHLVMRHRDVPVKVDLHDVAIRPLVLSASSRRFMFTTIWLSVALAVIVAM